MTWTRPLTASTLTLLAASVLSVRADVGTAVDTWTAASSTSFNPFPLSLSVRADVDTAADGFGVGDGRALSERSRVPFSWSDLASGMADLKPRPGCRDPGLP
jgi:hypothetical protein